MQEPILLGSRASPIGIWRVNGAAHPSDKAKARRVDQPGHPLLIVARGDAANDFGGGELLHDAALHDGDGLGGAGVELGELIVMAGAEFADADHGVALGLDIAIDEGGFEIGESGLASEDGAESVFAGGDDSRVADASEGEEAGFEESLQCNIAGRVRARRRKDWFAPLASHGFTPEGELERSRSWLERGRGENLQGGRRFPVSANRDGRNGIAWRAESGEACRNGGRRVLREMGSSNGKSCELPRISRSSGHSHSLH